mmetsp:Transcript_92805/g.267968  ORF Transcript_92805/g.267968 Transcript_92805/m.267968 type:complete len:283 (-) Transcript_92805:2647-3495(-)
MRFASCSAWSCRLLGRYELSLAPNCSFHFCMRNLAVGKQPCCMATCIARRSFESSASMDALASSINSQSAVLPFSAATCNGVRMSLLRLNNALRFASDMSFSSWNTGRCPARAAMCRKLSPSSGPWGADFSLLSMTSTYLIGRASASISNIWAHQGSVNNSCKPGMSLSLPFTTACAAKKFWKPFTKNLSSVFPPSCESLKNIAWPACVAAFKPSQTCCTSLPLGKSFSTSFTVMPNLRCNCMVKLIFSKIFLHNSTFFSLLWRSAICRLCTRCSMTSRATR